MWKMFIDDERFPVKEDEFIIVRTVEQAIDKIKELGCPDFISFDHDLGDNIPTGFDLAKYLVETDLNHNGSFIPNDFDYYVHSANPVGKKNISGLLDGYLSFKKTSVNKFKP